jgi:hypothetical protein
VKEKEKEKEKREKKQEKVAQKVYYQWINFEHKITKVSPIAMPGKDKQIKLLELIKK